MPDHLNSSDLPALTEACRSSPPAAAVTAQTGAEQARSDSPGPQRGPASTGQIQAQTAMAASQLTDTVSSDTDSTQTQPQEPAQPQQQPTPAQADSDAANRPGTQQTGQQQAQPTASTQGEGDVPPSSPAISSGRESPPLLAFGVPLARGPDGRLYNPAKGEPKPKSDSVADLKPLPARTYDESPGLGDSQKGGIQGLDSIPKGWGKLPPSVTLGVEIGWVQSERLLVVKELPTGRIKVDLSKASVPAPSMSALSWLETSIRSYAKFIEVASKQASSGQDEAEFVRKERMAIGEIRSILSEMMPGSKS